MDGLIYGPSLQFPLSVLNFTSPLDFDFVALQFEVYLIQLIPNFIFLTQQHTTRPTPKPSGATSNNAAPNSPRNATRTLSFIKTKTHRANTSKRHQLPPPVLASTRLVHHRYHYGPPEKDLRRRLKPTWKHSHSPHEHLPIKNNNISIHRIKNQQYIEPCPSSKNTTSSATLSNYAMEGDISATCHIHFPVTSPRFKGRI